MSDRTFLASYVGAGAALTLAWLYILGLATNRAVQFLAGVCGG